MRRHRRKPTADQLRAWLEDGSHKWVEKWFDDADVTAELDRLTALPDEHSVALRTAVEPYPGFDDRTVQGVGDRVGDLERVSVLLGLLGLGAQTARSMIDPDSQ